MDVKGGVFMYYIDDYMKKKDDENLNYVADTILDKIISNITLDNNYQFNYMLTGYNNKINKILSILNYKANRENIELEIKTQFIPRASTSLIINARYRNMFLKFMLIEKDLYKKIVEDNELIFDLKKNKLNTLYILDALKTAFYQAGYDSGKVLINDRVIKLDAVNRSLKYFPKVFSIEMINYYNMVENDRKNNCYKKHK